MSRVIRGDTERYTIPLVDPETLEPYPLHGCTVWLTTKKGPDLPDSEALYQHWITLDADGTVTGAEGLALGPDGAAAGVLVQELAPAETVDFDPGAYTYDIQIMLADGAIETPVLGDHETVVSDWTRAITRPGGTP